MVSQMVKVMHLRYLNTEGQQRLRQQQRVRTASLVSPVSDGSLDGERCRQQPHRVDALVQLFAVESPEELLDLGILVEPPDQKYVVVSGDLSILRLSPSQRARWNP